MFYRIFVKIFPLTALVTGQNRNEESLKLIKST